MKALICRNPSVYLKPRISYPVFLFRSPSHSRINGKVIHFPNRTRIPNLKSPRFSSLRARSATSLSNYGGWDELRVVVDESLGESNQFRNFLASIGIDDKKYVFMFLLGVFCALAISRVRVSSVIIFPASVVVFAIGFSFGFFRSGSFKFNDLNFSGSKKRTKSEFFSVYADKMKCFLGIFDEYVSKIDDLESGMKRALENKRIMVNDLESYVDAIEALRLSASNARNAIEDCNEIMDSYDDAFVENQKPSRKKKEVGENGFGLLQLIGGFFGESVVISKPDKGKGNVKREVAKNAVNDQVLKDFANSATRKTDLNSVGDGEANAKISNFQSSPNMSSVKQSADRRETIVADDKKTRVGMSSGTTSRFVNREEYCYHANRSRFMSDQHIFSKTANHNKLNLLDSSEDMLDSQDFRVSFRHLQTEASYEHLHTQNKSSGDFNSSYFEKHNESETYRLDPREEKMNIKENFLVANELEAPQSEVGSSMSEVASDDIVFDRYLAEANCFMRKAKEYIGDRCDEEHAEVMLYKSADVLSKATTMKPMSLLAVGQLGNTYLLHGELKLKISRKLRAVLSGRNPLSFEKLGALQKRINDQVTTRDDITSILIDVCEECEELLLEAGRKYRLALSIDGNDVRALYNWGLALSYRAQLIADIGQEAAYDADKVFLAAIDKFDAMLSKGNVYAPEALFRWGVVLQQRSHLRPRNSKEKVKLLLQAKRLFEDALLMGSEDLQVREALSSCVTELSYRNY